MQLTEIPDAREWERALSLFELVPPGQAASWSASRGFRGREVLRFASVTPGAIAAQGVLRRTLGMTRFIVHDGPILGRSCDEDTLLSFFTELRQRLGAKCILLCSSIQPYEPEHEVLLRKAGFLRPYSTVLSPLTLYVDCADIARAEAGYSPNWRREIRRGEKKGLLFESSLLADARAQADFLALYTETFRMKGLTPDIDVPMLGALGADPRWRVSFALQEGRRVSVRLCFVSGTTAFSVAAATNAEGRRISASHFLAAMTIRHFGSQGVQRYDLGRIGPGRYDSIDWFKLQSGGRPVAYLGEWSLSSRPWLDLAVGAVRLLKGRDRW